MTPTRPGVAAPPAPGTLGVNGERTDAFGSEDPCLSRLLREERTARPAEA